MEPLTLVNGNSAFWISNISFFSREILAGEVLITENATAARLKADQTTLHCEFCLR